MQGTNLCTEPKHIVFLSQLLVLFKFCHVCKADNPLIEAGGIGTEAVIKKNMQQSSMQQRENLVQSATDMWNSDACWELPPVSQNSTCRRVSHEGVPDVLTYGSWTCISQHIFQVSKA